MENKILILNVGEDNHLLQRFNGANFDNIPLPDTHLVASQDIYLTKLNDGLIYAVFKKHQDSRLYILHPKTVIFKDYKENIAIQDTDKNYRKFFRFSKNLHQTRFFIP
ncbi:MAG: hypothetical protein L3J09_04620 [Flavobacteriaceae bacterium]|nr:hypothetical protein [Flavobacteriaceae bacterium]